MLHEDDFVGAVCEYLMGRGFEIERKCAAKDRGDDIVARHPTGWRLYVEAKRGRKLCGGKQPLRENLRLRTGPAQRLRRLRPCGGDAGPRRRCRQGRGDGVPGRPRVQEARGGCRSLHPAAGSRRVLGGRGPLGFGRRRPSTQPIGTGPPVGGVSVATPVLGVKILLVALLTTMLLQGRVEAILWVAALSSVAIGLLGFTRAHSHHRVGRTIVLAGSAAIAYALFDVLVQKWPPGWGAGRFLPVMMAFVAGASFLLRSSRTTNPDPARSEATRFWVVAGAVCLGVQGLLIVSSIALYGQAPVVNVLYSSRVWLIGHWFSNPSVTTVLAF